MNKWDRLQQRASNDRTKTGSVTQPQSWLSLVQPYSWPWSFSSRTIKTVLVLAAAPYGMIGAFAAPWIMDNPFGFMAFPGVGVITDHRVRNRVGAGASRRTWWSVMETALLRRDRRPAGRDCGHETSGTSDVCNICS